MNEHPNFVRAKSVQISSGDQIVDVDFGDDSAKRIPDFIDGLKRGDQTRLITAIRARQPDKQIVTATRRAMCMTI